MRLIRIALYLGLTGSLVDATIAMTKHAQHAYQDGFISISELNRSLWGPPPQPLKHHDKNR